MNTKILKAKRSIELSEFAWFKSIIAVWLVVLAINNYEDYLPASYWFKVGDITIQSTAAGSNPVMTVDRTIKRPFRATFIVEVKRKVARNEYVQGCTGYLAHNYDPRSRLPDEKKPPTPITVVWWLGGNVNNITDKHLRCVTGLPKGTYKMFTAWPFLSPTGKLVVKESNEFTLY